MGKVVITGFRSLREAEAFRDGMLYVNDSSISDVEAQPAIEEGEWLVRFEDDDTLHDAEVPYVVANMGA